MEKIVKIIIKVDPLWSPRVHHGPLAVAHGRPHRP